MATVLLSVVPPDSWWVGRRFSSSMR